VYALREGPDRSLWLGTSHGLLRLLADGSSVAYRLPRPGASEIVYAVHLDLAGRMWIGHRSGLGIVVPPDPAPGVAPPSVELQPVDTHLTAGRRLQLPGPGDPGVWITAPDGPSRNAVRDILEARDGTIWISQVGRGLIRFADGSFTRYTAADGLADESLGGLAEDDTGGLWAGTDLAGAMRFDWNGFYSYGRAAGLAHTFIRSITEDTGGDLWIVSGLFSVNKYADGAFRSGRPQPPLGQEELSFYETGLRDSQGEWWVPTVGGLFRFPRVDAPEAF
jgi:ligand-binding sensor domain-containing protein